MNRLYVYCGIGICIVLGLIVAVIDYRVPSRIEVYTGESITLSNKDRKIGFLGCTPHPTRYLQSQQHPLRALQDVTLATIIDTDDVQDSFNKTIELCVQHDIDHLFIAYLPIYCIDMRPILQHQFVEGCMLFFERIHAEILPFIHNAITAYGYDGNVTLILPSRTTIQHVPVSIGSIDDRIRYLIKEFPRITNLNQSQVTTIAIINNKESQEDDQLISYLKYEYLYERPVTYEKYTTNKERFHSYK